MKKAGLFFLLLCSLTVFDGCAAKMEQGTISTNMGNNVYQADIPEFSGKKLNTLNCMLDTKVLFQI